MKPTFSQRKGLKPTIETIQTDSITEALRNSLWNVLDSLLWSSRNFVNTDRYTLAGIEAFSKTLWASYFKLPMDTIPEYEFQIMDSIRKHYFGAKWNEVYDFIEFVASYADKPTNSMYAALNMILERELSAYRFIGGQLTDITSEQELQMLNEALSDTQFTGVTRHLQRALELYADRENPDHRNSIKESISAVESMAKIATGNPKATLGSALKTLAKDGKLHESLNQGFQKLYGYTSEEGGIRHAMMDDPNLTAADAKYFLLSCTSFVNYLKSKM